LPGFCSGSCGSRIRGKNLEIKRKIRGTRSQEPGEKIAGWFFKNQLRKGRSQESR